MFFGSLDSAAVNKQPLSPESAARFLDFASERILLYKVGSGQTFIHGLLQDCFAGLAREQA